MALKSVAFDRAAGYYDQTRGFPAGEERPAAALFAKAGSLSKTSRILEVGIGTGRIALPVSEFVGQIVGVDIARPMIKRLLEKRTTEQIYPIEADGTQLPFADGSFDAVMAVHIFHLIPNPRGVLAEMARVLKPGASLIHGWDEGETRSVPRDVWGADPVDQNEKLTAMPWTDRKTFPIEAGWRYMGDELKHAYHYLKAPQGTLDEVQNRVWSHTWRMSDDQIAEAVNKIKTYLAEHFEDPTKPVEHQAAFHVQAYVPG